MSISSGAVKATAKQALKGNYIRVAIISLILILTWLLCVNLSNLAGLVIGEFASGILNAVLQILFVGPLALGVLKYVWKMLFGITDRPIAVFYWFSDKEIYLKSVKLVCHFVLRIAVWLLILNIPSIFLFILSKGLIYDLLNISPPIWTGSLDYPILLLRNLSFVVVFFLMLKFYMVPLLFVADENIDVNEAFYNSSVISRKSSIDFIGLIFSSAVYVILSFFVLPLPLTMPLLLSYYAVHCRFAVTEYNQHIENSKFTEASFI